MSWNAALPADPSKIRVSAGFIRDNNAPLQTALSLTTLNSNIPYIPDSSSLTPAPIWMYLDTAPTGWTLYASVSDCLLAVKGGSSQYNTTGGTGSTVGTWSGPAVTLTLAQSGGLSSSNPISTTFGVNPYTYATGAPVSHEHDWTSTRPQAALGILVTKNA